MGTSFTRHIAILQSRYQEAFELSANSGIQIDSLLIHSGSPAYYFADDQDRPFRSYGHFNHWLPVNRPEQMVLITPGKRPMYFRIVPSDYWYDQAIESSSWWSEEFEIIPLTDSIQVDKHLPGRSGIAFIGENTTFASELGFDINLVNPQALLVNLDFHRAYKSDYEIEQLRSANKLALSGHSAARRCFENGGSEYDIHMAFLQACNIIEEESPYTNIVALDEKSAILHYQHKRRSQPEKSANASQMLLIDAGCRINGYCSDITRTSVQDTCHSVFKSLVATMETIELELVSRVRHDMDYVDLHRGALELIAQALIEHDIVHCSPEQALELGLPSLFMPHGVGHLLGIQVHDVGGHLTDPAGRVRPPPQEFPNLRNTRIMRENMVFTVEPGLYFIPLLLDKERETERGKFLNRILIDELIPLGGIRVEDNVRVTRDTAENLTRGRDPHP